MEWHIKFEEFIISCTSKTLSRLIPTPTLLLCLTWIPRQRCKRNARPLLLLSWHTWYHRYIFELLVCLELWRCYISSSWYGLNLYQTAFGCHFRLQILILFTNLRVLEKWLFHRCFLAHAITCLRPLWKQFHQRTVLEVSRIHRLHLVLRTVKVMVRRLRI